MKEIAKVIQELKYASGTIHKKQLLEKYKGIEGLKDVLHFIYNPFIRTGIAAAKLAKAPLAGVTPTYKEVIEYYKQNQTGTMANAAYGRSFIEQYEGAERELAIAMVTKNLTIGVAIKLLQDVYGKNFIPKIDVMLGKKYEDYHGKVKGPFIVTEKLDGTRRIIIKQNGSVRMFSRSGIEDSGLVDIESDAMLLPDNCVYDGELLAQGNFKDSIALRQATNSITSTNGIRSGLDFHIFDMIPVEEYQSGPTTPAWMRKLLLGSVLGDKSVQLINKEFTDFEMPALRCIKAVPILGVIEEYAEIKTIAQKIWDRGGEGVMLNTFFGPYELKRSKELLKVKKVDSYDLPIIGYQEGNGKYSGMLGALVVDYKGNEVAVGSGFTDYDRQDVWTRRDDIIGQLIEIDSFGESKNNTGTLSLSCPIFKGFRSDKE